MPAERKRKSEKRQRTATVAIRLLPEERDRLRAEAAFGRVSLSELVRRRALTMPLLDVLPGRPSGGDSQ